jgi:hypothetical protein
MRQNWPRINDRPRDGQPPLPRARKSILGHFGAKEGQNTAPSRFFLSPLKKRSQALA